MGETEKERRMQSSWQKAESLLFPAAAAVIGVGYALAMLVNNPLGKVFHSPHALILLAIFAAIAFFPLKTLYHEVATKAGPGDSDAKR